MHTRSIALIAVLLFAAFASTATAAGDPTGTNGFSVTVTASGKLYVPLYPRAAHVRIYNESGAGISVRFRQRIFGSNGQWSGGWLYSPGPPGSTPSYITGTPYPTAADTTLAVQISTITAWNVFNYIHADAMWLVNEGIYDRTLYVETMEK